MTKLFGVDIAKEIATGMGPGLLKGTLFRIVPGTRDPAATTSGVNPATRRAGFRGIVADYTTDQIDGTVIISGDKRVLILGGTLPKGVVPVPDDQLAIDGLTDLYIVRVTRDPASAAYSCQARGR